MTVKMRDRVAHRMANWILQTLATPEYRVGIERMINHGMIVAMADDPSVRIEWVRIDTWKGGVRGWIPRKVLDSFGVNTSPLDKCYDAAGKWCGDNPHSCDKPGHRQGAVFLDRTTSEKARAHPMFRLELDDG